MFYNYYRSTNLARKEMANKNLKKCPSQSLLNKQKREKLKDLLLIKFLQKYQALNQEKLIENEVTKFVEKEKLTDVDLQRLNNRIAKLLNSKSPGNILINRLTRNNSETILDRDNFTLNNSSNNNTIGTNYKNNIKKNIYKTNDELSLPKINSDFHKTYYLSNNNTISVDGKKTKNFISKKNTQQTQEEEYEELKEEIKKEEGEKHSNRIRLDFSKEGDEWSAITRYNKKLYEEQLLEKKLRSNELKRRIKAFLDFQVKEKMEKEYENEKKDKEYSKIIQENLKKLEEIDRKKEQALKSQILREKKSRDEILKKINLNKEIEELNEKKRQKEYVQRIKDSLELEKKQKYELRKQKKEELIKAIKENELKKEKIKEEKIKEKQMEMNLLEEQRKQEDHNMKEREQITNKIYCNGSKYIMKQAEENVKKMKENEKKEEEKFLYYYNEKRKKDEESLAKEKMRKKKEKNELKQFLDRQIEEKQKEKDFLKNLDFEQAKIWDIDFKKYNEKEKIINKKLKDMNMTNFKFIVRQMNSNKNSKKKNSMTDNEYFMNKDLLEKVKASL